VTDLHDAEKKWFGSPRQRGRIRTASGLRNCIAWKASAEEALGDQEQIQRLRKLEKK
jgi:hypothetical protein